MQVIEGKAWEAGAKQFHVCQTFIVKDFGSYTNLVELEQFHLSKLAEAVRKAERMVELGQVKGAIAYSIVVDEEAGEYGEMQDVEEFGCVPARE